ncbi:MAG: hypothetical protein NTW74_26535 [Acidobacteria bacterium]|nr:hypothetical protein [Acidobacteriota bacterium]
MIYLLAILCGLLLGAALGFGTGFAAAELFTKLGGARDGGAAMAGFFHVGPFGLVAGFLLGAALVLQYGGAAGTFSKGLFWGGGIVAGLGVIVLILPVLLHQSQKTTRAKINLQMQFAVAVANEAEISKLRWGYQGEAQEGNAAYDFYNRKLEGEVFYLQGDMQMSDNPSRRVAYFSSQGKTQSFSIAKAGPVHEISDWSEWQQGDAVKFRWRMAAAQ